MPKGSGVALKFLQWFIRGIQFGSAAVVLALTSYFLATLHNHDLTIATWLRAVEGISGAAVVYTIVGLLLLCCLAGFALTSFIAIVLDLAFIGGFIYIAVSYRNGASTCRNDVDTPFGSGDAQSQVSDNPDSDGFTKLPSYRTACKMQTACLAVSIIAIFFFLLSIGVEILLARHRKKEKRFGPSPANNYTSGSPKRRGIFGFGRRNRAGTAGTADPNALPLHSTPADIRQSHATETTYTGEEVGHHKEGVHNNGVINDGTHNRYGA